MSENNLSKVEQEKQLLAEAQSRGFGSTLAAFLKMSGPGWLQSGITLGGGSLASSLFLGILGGYAMLWVQPIAMILGIIMLSAIGYVTLSTGERPFRAINQHINPVLGWGWALAVAAANIVWCLPQYALANGVLSQNLLPGLLGGKAVADGVPQSGAVLDLATSAFGENTWMADNANKLVVAVVVLIVCTAVTWSYDRGGKGLRLYETILKSVVTLIVVCFIGVVGVIAYKGALSWDQVFTGLIPDFSQFHKPAASFDGLLQAIADPLTRQYWSDVIVQKQVDVMASAAATAVGINMTFLYPYSLLRKGWTREFRGLSIFDLSTGMFIPYLLATSCVVLASAAQFHTKITKDFEVTGNKVIVPSRFQKNYNGLITARTAAMENPVTLNEQKLAATLVDRKASDLSEALTPLTGSFVANLIFGLGVLAMTLSTISILMLISGFVFAEMLGFPPGGLAHKLGTLVAGIGGAFGPFIWSGAAFYLAVPTSVFGLMLLPFAYITFVLLMNQKNLLKRDAPRGFGKFVWNVLMLIAAAVASVAAVYMVYIKTSYWGIAAVVGLVLLALMVQINRYNEKRFAEQEQGKQGTYELEENESAEAASQTAP